MMMPQSRRSAYQQSNLAVNFVEVISALMTRQSVNGETPVHYDRGIDQCGSWLRDYDLPMPMDFVEGGNK